MGLWEKLVKEKSKEGSQGELKEEQIDANLWDKLVLEQAKRNKSSIVDEAIARAAKEKKDQEVDRKLEEDVSLLTETDWAAAINFLKMEQFSSRDIAVLERLQEEIKKGKSDFEALVRRRRSFLILPSGGTSSGW